MVISKAITALVLAICACLPALAQGTAKSRPSTAQTREATALNEAEALLQSKQYAQAEEKLQKIVDSDAANPQAWFDLGFAQTNLGKSAIISYQKAVDLSPKWFEANLNLGLALASAGDMRAAIPALKHSLELKPTSDAAVALNRAWLALAQALEAGGDPKEAAAAFDKCAELDPKDTDSLLNAGSMLQKSGDSAGAAQRFQKAAEAGNLNAMAQLINLLAAQQKYADAETWLRRYVAGNPKDAAAHIQLSRLYSIQGKNKEAIAELENVNSPAAKRELADLYLANKEYAAAEPLFQQLIQVNPMDAQLAFDLGISQLYQHKYDAAETSFKAALFWKQDFPDAYLYLAEAADQGKHYETVVRSLDTRARYGPETPKTYFLRATAYDNLRVYKQAAANYKLFLAASAGKYPDQEFQARHRLKAIEPQ